MNKELIGTLQTGVIHFTGSNATININDVDFFIFKKNTLNALHLDMVVVEIFKNKNKIEARVVEVLSRYRTQFVGRVSKNEKIVFVKPDSQKIKTDFYIIDSQCEYGNDDKVLVELIQWEIEDKSPQAVIIRNLGNVGNNETEINSIMLEYDLPMDFPAMVEAESELITFDIPQEEIDKRRDMRHITTFTIDPLTAKDFDDALSIEYLGEDIEIGIHIADVSHYVKPDGIIDDEAIKRGTSVYLVDRCVPMLPERLSNGVCSLRPHEEKLSFSVVVKFDKNFEIKSKWVGRTVIYSDHRFTYEQAQDIIEGIDTTNPFKADVLLMDTIAKKMRAERIKAGAIEMNSTEVRFELDEVTKKPIGVNFKVQKDSNKLIEEFMLLANKIVANMLKKEAKICVNRAHPKPDLGKIMEVKSIVRNFGYVFNFNENDLKPSINRLLKEIEGKPEQNMITTLITRSMSKAYYTTNDIGHFGLSFDDYCHFTSPIRRYSDIMIHRLLEKLIESKQK